MKVLVAGASGFIGRNFLLKTPTSWSVSGIYNSSTTFPEFLKKNKLNHVVALHCDLRDSAQVVKTFATSNEFDVCLFVLGNSDIGLSSREPAIDAQSNIVTLLNLITHTKVKKFIFMSSGTVYLGHPGAVDPKSSTRPLVPYGVHKLASELYMQYFQQKTDRIKEYVILRFFGAYGPMELPRKIYTNLIKAFVFEGKREYTIAGSGQNYIDAMYIDDTVDGLMKIIHSPKANVVVDFCKGEPLTINGLVQEVAKILGQNNLKLHNQGTSSEFITFHASTAGMKNAFGFEPKISLKEGMTKFAQYMKDNQNA